MHLVPHVLLQRHAARAVFQEALEELEMNERDLAWRQAEREAQHQQMERSKVGRECPPLGHHFNSIILSDL